MTDVESAQAALDEARKQFALKLYFLKGLGQAVFNFADAMGGLPTNPELLERFNVSAERMNKNMGWLAEGYSDVQKAEAALKAAQNTK